MQIMDEENRFVIVTFVDEGDAPGIVSSNWIQQDSKTCFYPNVRTEEMKEKLLRRMVEPDDTWPQYQIKILKGYETYGEARIHLKKAEETSNLESDEGEKKRKKKRKINVYLPEDSDDSSDDYHKLSNKTRKVESKKKGSKYPTPPSKIIRTQSPPAATEATTEDITPIQSINRQSDSTAVPIQSECAVNKQSAMQQCHIIQVLTDLSKQVMEITKKLDFLLLRAEVPFNQQTENVSLLPDFLTDLPVTNDDSFANLNEQLKISQNKQAMVQFLAGIGGKDPRSFTTNMLRRILLDDVAEKYSLTGKKMKNSDKKPFIVTETCKIIFQICKKVHADATDDKLKEIVSDWLNQAKIRLSRREERQQKLSASVSS